MACEKYNKCDYCKHNDDCPLNWHGDGSPFCGKFQCTFKDCKRFECISYDEELEVYKNY